MTDTPLTLTRKDIARMLDVSVRTVASCEKLLGLDVARINVNRKTIRYSVRVLRANQRWFRAVDFGGRNGK